MQLNLKQLSTPKISSATQEPNGTNLQPTSPTSILSATVAQKPGGWSGHIYTLAKVIDNMMGRGLPVDEEKRIEFKAYLEENEIRVRALISAHLAAKGEELDEVFDGFKVCKVMPKDLRAWLLENGWDKVGRKIKGKIQKVTRMPKENTLVGYKYPAFSDEYYEWFLTKALELGYEFMPENENGMLFAKRVYFNPQSTQQLASYCEKNGYKIPLSMKKTSKGREEKESLDDKALKELARLTKDPIFPLIEELREVNKLVETYAEGWKVNGEDGRLHSLFTFQPATGQLSSRGPNVQTAPSRSGDYGKQFKSIVRARPGRVILNLDYSGYHAVMLGYFAKCGPYMRLASMGIHDFLAANMLEKMIPELKPAKGFNSIVTDPKWRAARGAGFAEWGDEKIEQEEELVKTTLEHITDLSQWLSYDDATLRYKLKKIKQLHGHLRDKQAKPACIAEGSLVLTSNGLKPIESVTIRDKVWDGVEWVTHEGLIYQGVRDVITYQGLTATADHKVYTQEGWKVSFGEAASKGYTIIQTGSDGTAVRLGENSQCTDEENKRILAFENEMYAMQNDEVYFKGYFTDGQIEWMPSVQPNYMPTHHNTWQSLRRYIRALQSFTQPQLSQLWRTWNQMFIHFTQAIYPMGMGEFATQGLQELGNRSQQQRRTLRAWESALSFPPPELQQQINYREGVLARTDDTSYRMGQPLQLRSHQKISSSEQTNRRTNHPTIQRKKVYDLYNAGPRHRFTVNNLLANNCHGIGFGMGVKKLYDMNKESFTSMKEAENIRGIMKSLFPEIFTFQDKIVAQAHRDKKLISPFGYVRRFYEAMVMKPGYSSLVKGEDAEKVIAFLPANTAFAIKKEAMIRLEDMGANDKYCLFNEVHDSLMYEPLESDLEEAYLTIVNEMTRPVIELADPLLCPDGLVVEAEISYGSSWKELKEVKL